MQCQRNNTLNLLDSNSSHSTMAARGDNDKTALLRFSSTGFVSRNQASSRSSSPCSSSITPSTSQQQRVVTFKKSVHVKRVNPLSSYTKEEIEACWYTCSETAAVKQEVKHVVTQWLRTTTGSSSTSTSPKFCTDDFCCRGLEHRTQKGAASQAQRRKVACSFVLKEQRRQKGQGVCQPDHIASAYAAACRRDRDVAYQRAKEDAAEAEAAATP